MALVVGCSASPDQDGAGTDVRTHATGDVHTNIYSGTSDTESKGVVALKVGSSVATNSFELCTGTLLAPNVVLTARHCVSKAVTTTVSCNQEGNSANGDHVGADLDPSGIQIYAGTSPNFAGSPTALVKKSLHPAGGVLCNADIAVLVLDRDIPGAQTIPVRLQGGLRKGEAIRSVGYGQNDAKVPVGTRLRKEAVPVLALGKTVSASKTPLGTREFEVGLSICQGDSGGPAISEETGAVVGVVSRGGDCAEDFGHIYTTTSGFEDMIRAAFDEAGVPMNAEPPPADANVWMPQARSQDASGQGKRVGTPTEEEGAAPSSSASCAAAPTGARGASGWLAIAAAAAIAIVRRRRKA